MFELKICEQKEAVVQSFFYEKDIKNTINILKVDNVFKWVREQDKLKDHVLEGYAFNDKNKNCQ